jgi:retron-type reverse transcriptase
MPYIMHRTKLSIYDIIKLLRFTLTNSYFNYNKKTYKQIHGCAMGSPVSPIVANLCMEEIEDTACT